MSTEITGCVILKYPSGPIMASGRNEDEALENYEDIGGQEQVYHYVRYADYSVNEPMVLVPATARFLKYLERNGTFDEWQIVDGVADLRITVYYCADPECKGYLFPASFITHQGTCSQ